ncbi:cordon-bleu protein-like 1 isoform X2 [Bombina bombina]|nr:cordon-bleu protein-like 1 isoform X2 [Bombina bombina]
MEQKENIDRDVELTVVLPGERTTSTIVSGSKPMMDLLILLCGQYHLNPSTYTIEAISSDKGQLKFKPNTPIGMLEVEKVVLKSKIPDDKNKKSGPVIPEQSVRLVINYKKTQKTIMRVSPHAPLQDIIPSICNKCDFDPQHTLLLKDYQSQKPLDVTKSLNDLGLRELYAMDTSIATSPTDFRIPPLQESCQNVETKANDDKGFFNFFRRSKKKRDQTSSAPATPLLSKSRPQNVVRANTVSKSYDSNTLPSDVPKKRRAPLPPMLTSNNISRQMRTSSCVVKSVTVDESEKVLPGIDRSRTGSLPHRGSSSLNSSLMRTKRKAPLPPSPPPKTSQELNDENSNEIAHVSEEIIQVDNSTENESPKMVSPTDLSEHNLEEVAEDEVSFSHQEEYTDAKTEDISISSASTDVMTEPETQNSSVVSDTGRSMKSSEDDLITEIKSIPCQTEDANENNLTEHDIKDHRENEISTQSSELTDNIQLFESKAINTEPESQTLSDIQHNENKDTNIPEHGQIESKEDFNTEKGKTQDSAVQTVDFYSAIEVEAEKEASCSYNSSTTSLRGTDLLYEADSQISQQVPFYNHQHEVSGKEADRQEIVDLKKEITHVKESMDTQTVVKESVGESKLHSLSKSNQLQRQNTEPKLKPSNEIRRDYLPKYGMTTYKIVPQRSFDVERYVEHNDLQDPKKLDSSTLTQQTLSSQTVSYTKNISPVVPNTEHNECSLLRNGNHTTQDTSNISTSPVSKNIEVPVRREHVPIIKSLSSASGPKNTSELKSKDNSSGSVKAPSSFYLQMQRRASSMYVTSAIAKSAKISTSVTNNTAKLKDIGKDMTQVSIKTLPSKIDVVHLPLKVTEKNSEAMQTIYEKPSDSKNEVLETISEKLFEVKSQPHLSHAIVEKHSMPNKEKCEVSLINVLENSPELVSSQDENRNENYLRPTDLKIYELTQPESIKETSTTSFNDKSSNEACHEQNSESFSKTKTVRSLSSPTGQSVPMSLQKLRTFATPRPFSSINVSPFTSAVSTAVKRSQSFSSSTSPVKETTKVDTISGWAPVTSPTEIKNESTMYSGNPGEESLDKETLTHELKYRVHSPPPTVEKKVAVHFQSSDPELIRQSLLDAIRSGEAAANLKKITVRSNTISINGRSRISHPVFSETQHEA